VAARYHARPIRFGHTSHVLSRRRGVGALTLLIAVASCSSGRGTATVPPTAIPSAIAISVPGARPLPTVVRKSTKPSSCPRVLPTNFAQRGVARLDISLVAIAAVDAEVCVYGGSVRAGALRSHVAFDGVAAETIASALNGVAGIDPVSGPRCEPGADASAVIAISDGLRIEQFLASLAGCRGVSNGLLSGAGTPSSTAVLRRAIVLADLCRGRFGPSASCIAGTS
jgi:hypothetical protein